MREKDNLQDFLLYTIKEFLTTIDIKKLIQEISSTKNAGEGDDEMGGDMDDDGLDEILITAPQKDTENEDVGAIYLIMGSTMMGLPVVNVAQEANNGSVFNITDQTVLNQLEDLLLSNASVDVQFTGTAISNESPVSFDLELFLNITVALN